MPIIIVLLVILLVLIGGGTYFYINGNRLMLPGEWGREIDITDQVRYEAKEYIESYPADWPLQGALKRIRELGCWYEQEAFPL